MALTSDSGDFQRRVEFVPGWNELHDKSGESIGQHGMEISYALIGGRGAVSIGLHTAWTPLGIVDEHLRNANGEFPANTVCHPIEPSTSHLWPMPQTIGFHWTKPFREDMSINPDCEFLYNGECYSDVSFAGAPDIIRAFITDGEEALWAGLQDQYEWMLGSEEDYLHRSI